MGARKGRIVVDFVSLEELERLMGVMIGAQRDPERISLD